MFYIDEILNKDNSISFSKNGTNPTSSIKAVKSSMDLITKSSAKVITIMHLLNAFDNVV